MNEFVPEGWSQAKVGSLSSKVGSGVTPRGGSKAYSTSGVKFIRSQNVHFTGLKLNDVVYISQDIHDSMLGSQLQDNDVLLNITGASIGRCTFVPNSFGAANVNQHVCIIRPNEKIKSAYLSQWFSSDSGQNAIMRYQAGGNREGLNFQQIRSMIVTLPPLPEQQKIAAILTSVDEVIEKTQAQINKLKDLKTGMMQELLTRGVGVDGKPHTEFKDSPVGRIPKGWDVVSVGSLVNVIDPQPDHRTPPEVNNGIPYVGLGDIDQSGAIDFSGARKVSQTAFEKQCRSFDIHEGAFVFGKIGTIGNPSILPEQRFYCLSANVVLISGADYEVLRYIFQVFTSGIINEQIAQQTNTTSQPALGIKKVRDFLVPLPTRNEMKFLVNTLSSVDSKYSKLESKLSKLKSNKKALMQDLLTGKVRVKVDS